MIDRELLVARQKVVCETLQGDLRRNESSRLPLASYSRPACLLSPSFSPEGCGIEKETKKIE